MEGINDPLTDGLQCKSCEKPIAHDQQYCAHCGGLIVKGRLSVKGTWTEFIGPFFS